MQDNSLVNGEVYHVISRTVGDTVIFEGENDFYRGIFSIYEFNDSNPVKIWEKRRTRINLKKKIVQRPTLHNFVDKRDKLVEIWAFSFMPNHLHLILKQLKDHGISKFMKKVNGGYAKYFNEKYSRKGHLFNKFKAVHITSDQQLKIVFTYVHTNLISIVEPGWKEKGVRNVKKVKEFLENNKKHSYSDYLGIKSFPSVTQREFLLELMEGSDGCRDAINNWIIHKKGVKDFEDIFKKIS